MSPYKNFWQTVQLALVLTYDIFLIYGTVVLVEDYNWSMWTFLLTLLFFLNYKPGKDTEPPKEESKIIL
jgi:hypothetical protein